MTVCNSQGKDTVVVMGAVSLEPELETSQERDCDSQEDQYENFNLLLTVLYVCCTQHSRSFDHTFSVIFASFSLIF